MKAKKVYCFGNPDVKEDKIAFELADELGKDKELERFEFVKCTSPDFLLNLDEKEIVILDVVKGIKDVQVIEDIDKLKATKTTTMHDFDLGTVLGLMKETGRINKIKIIGLPQKNGKAGKELKTKIISALKKM